MASGASRTTMVWLPEPATCFVGAAYDAASLSVDAGAYSGICDGAANPATNSALACEARVEGLGNSTQFCCKLRIPQRYSVLRLPYGVRSTEWGFAVAFAAENE